jgi:hypothetical protein
MNTRIATLNGTSTNWGNKSKKMKKGCNKRARRVLSTNNWVLSPGDIGKEC